MERVEFAPDEELGEKLVFEWPEESGLTLDDFEVYQMFDRLNGGDYMVRGPLWMGVCEPKTIKRRLMDWIFVASNQSVDERTPAGMRLHFVRAMVSPENLSWVTSNTKEWYVPVISLRHGFLFQNEMDATMFNLWKGPDSPDELVELMGKIGYGK